MPRYLEIDMTTGIAFHQPDPLTQFVGSPPPTEVLFCDCEGVGVICHHTYASGSELTVDGATVTPQTRAAFLAAHPDCTPRRQVFVDVTDQPTVQLDRSGATALHYDEASGVFTVVPQAVTRVTKTALLTLLGPQLVAAWFSSADPVLVYGREQFKADTSVDLNSDVIAQVLAQAVALKLVDAAQAQAISAALVVK